MDAIQYKGFHYNSTLKIQKVKSSSMLAGSNKKNKEGGSLSAKMAHSDFDETCENITISMYSRISC